MLLSDQSAIIGRWDDFEYGRMLRSCADAATALALWVVGADKDRVNSHAEPGGSSRVFIVLSWEGHEYEYCSTRG